ncbi:hypothetical protein RSOLAG1IB_09991 [Rhizoctonia solani AG-1 IB]|uniref:AAA+ ATPase domain-containing protein n=1 Tax=Thanatephorus cucumeris (strain AG1-IB / isolate 7/3/14) TaxID=1108050 RepID=A0A0B7FWZ2_THACB|nr:hypothetical protein RSOLAG1IB_09991 [Rhizoctonia solani AG-1 IB]
MLLLAGLDKEKEADTYMISERLKKLMCVVEDSRHSARLVPGIAPTKSALKSIQSKRQITILLVGETGSGKTALLSLLVNLFQGYGPLELEDENDYSKESGLDKQDSQTNNATLYDIRTPNGAHIAILDTPGLADTRGIQYDRNHLLKINMAVQEFTTTIDAVLFIANGTTERISANTTYAFSTLASILPSSILTSIGLVFTHCDPFTRNLEAEGLPTAIRECRQWSLQNPLAYLKRYREELKSGLPEHMVQEGSERVQTLYAQSITTVNGLLSWIARNQPQPSTDIDRMYQSFIQAEKMLQRATQLYLHVSGLLQEAQTIEHNLGSTRKARVNINASKSQTIEYWERTSTSYHNLICIADNCYSNCDTMCSQPFTLDPIEIAQSSKLFNYPTGSFSHTEDRTYWVGRACNRCTHRADQHRHYKHLNVRRTAKLDTKSDMGSLENDEQKLLGASIALREQLKLSGEEYSQAREQAQTLVREYNIRALNKSFESHIISTINMLEYHRESVKRDQSTTKSLVEINDAIKTLKEGLRIAQLA